MSPRSLPLVLLVLATVPGCFGPVFAPRPSSTTGDRGRTEWHIADGLCSGGGLFGGACDLSTPIAVGATALVAVHGSDGGPLAEGTHFTAESANVSLTTGSGNDTYLHVAATRAGTLDLLVLDRDEQEIDRVHLTFTTASELECGRLDTSVPRDYELDGIVTGPASIVETLSGGTTPTADTAFACRALDASGHALLTVDAITWSIAPGATGSITVQNDHAILGGAAVGATVRVVTSGTGSGTVHAQLGDAGADVAVTFR